MESRCSESCSIDVSTAAPAWDEYLARCAGTTLFHDARWGKVMENVYGNRAYFLTARRGDRVVGVLQIVAQKSLLFGSHLCSLPYLDAAGILADGDDARAALMSEAGKLMGRLKSSWVELRQSSEMDGAVPSRTDKVTLVLPLPGTSEELWKALSPKVRNQVRKAERAGLAASSSGGELLKEFYGIYVRNMRDLGSPAHSLRFFRLLEETFGAAVRLFVVRSGETCLAASFTFVDGRTVRVPWAGSDWRAKDTCANMLLYWSMLSRACDAGAGTFDFGRSTRDSGTYRFKTQWGAEEKPLYWYYVLPEGGEIPDLRPDSPKYRLMVACWQRLPLGLTRLLGPRLIRKLS
jgi:FemAB-related protein (PEP-CTERM system-associated)